MMIQQTENNYINFHKKEVEQERKIENRETENPQANEIKIELRKQEEKPLKEIEKPEENEYLKHIAPNIIVGNTTEFFKIMNQK